MTYQEYYAEVNAIAKALVTNAMADNDNNPEQAMDDINDSRLHETIDGRQWVIYNSYNLDIIKHSDNDEYMIDNLGAECAVETLESGGLIGLHQALAFWAFYADVQEVLQEKMDELADTEEE